MSGQTSWASHPAESTLGGWWKVPMVVNPILGSNPGVVDSFVFTSGTSQKNDAGTILRGGIPNVSRINRVSVGEHTIVKSQRCTEASSRFNLSSPAAGTAAIAASTRFDVIIVAARIILDSTPLVLLGGFAGRRLRFYPCFDGALSGVSKRVEILHVEYPRRVRARGP